MSQELTITTNALAVAGQAANHAAARSLLADYREGLAGHTVRRQDADLALFAAYLADGGVDVHDLAADTRAWAGVTWGIVAGFVRWQLQQGYAIGSVNVRLATVKAYCRIATTAGDIPANEYTLITTVKG